MENAVHFYHLWVWKFFTLNIFLFKNEKKGVKIPLFEKKGDNFFLKKQSYTYFQLFWVPPLTFPAIEIEQKGVCRFPILSGSQVWRHDDVTMKNFFNLKKYGHIIYRWKALDERIKNRIRSVVSKWRHQKI